VRTAVRAAAIAVLLLALPVARAWAHAGLRSSDPLAGARLGDSPAAITLTFSEPTDPSLADIRVSGPTGEVYQIGRPVAVSGDRLSISVPLRRLDQGVYVVTWRGVSAVDGHATSGTYTFGVRADPGSVAPPAAGSAAIAMREIVARVLLIAGLIVLLGAAAASMMRFGGDRDLVLAVGGCVVAWAGLALLVVAQQQAAGATLAVLARTPVGRGLEARAVALLLAAAALIAARFTAHGRRRLAMSVAGLAAIGAIAAHVLTGHAAAATGSTMWLATIGQLSHFAAAGVWFGGLLALVAALDRRNPARAVPAIRRFSNIAAVCLVLVAASGLLRGVEEVASWQEAVSTGYGRALLAKVVLTVLIAALGALNRWRTIGLAATTTRPLSRVAAAELTLALAAIGAAALLGTLAPPASARVPFLTASGADYGTTVRVELTTASDQPGPNRFTLRLTDYDSGEPVRPTRVSLRFTPLDDPGIASTTLALAPAADDRFEGSGPNVAFDGRWGVTVTIEREREAIQVPLEIATTAKPQFVSIARFPGEKPMFTVEVPGLGHIRYVPDAETAGSQRLRIECLDVLREPQPMTSLVVTASAPGQPVRQLSVSRLSSNVFETTLELVPGNNVLVATGRTANGSRLRAEIPFTIPRPR
jgi:copper transport protein